MNDTVKKQLAKLNKESGTESKPEQEFQEYRSAKIAPRLITREGVRITFTNHKHLTQNKDVIAYLDSEIENGLVGFTKGEVLTTTDLDPMAKLRKDMRAEVLAELAEEAKQKALGNSKDMGTTENAPKIKPLSTKGVAS